MRYVLLNPTVPSNDREIAFQFWHSIWLETLNKLEGVEQLYADEFFKAHAVSCMFDGNNIVGLHIFNHYNFDDELVKKLKSVSCYPEIAWANLARREVKRLMTFEWLCLNPEYRKSFASVVMFTISILYLINCGADVALTLTNNERKVNRLSEQFGGVPLCANGFEHNVEVSFMAFYPDNARKCLNPDWVALAEECLATFRCKKDASANLPFPNFYKNVA